MHTGFVSSWFHPALSSFADHSPTLLSSQDYHSTTTCCCSPVAYPHPSLYSLPPPAATHQHLSAPPHCFFPHLCLSTTTCHCTTTPLSPNCLPTHPPRPLPHTILHPPSPATTTYHYPQHSTAHHPTQHQLLSNSCSYCLIVPTIHHPAFTSHLEVLDCSISSSV